MKGLFLILTISIISINSSFSQIIIHGKIRNSETNETIPFANIAIIDLWKGTSSNIDGEFLLKVDSLPVNLRISHVSFNRKDIEIVSEDYIEIVLEPAEILLNELVIKEKGKRSYAHNLMIRAYKRAVDQAGKYKYGRSFYRQISQNGDDYTELYEIFYDTRFSSQGVTDWAIQEGRYAMKKGPHVAEYVFNKNFTLLFRLLNMYQPETDKYVMPVNPDVGEWYNLEVKELRNINGRKVLTIGFYPKEEIYRPAMIGDIMIDIDNADILYIKGTIQDDNFNIIGLANKNSHWEKYSISIEASYRDGEEGMILDHIYMDQNFHFFQEDTFVNEVQTSAFLSYYEFYTPAKRKALGGRLLRFNKSDRNILDKIGYNRNFWDNNPIVKRTPVEEEVIASFEAVSAFGSIYLNDREQIQLEEENLDDDPFIHQIQTYIRKTKIPTSGEKVYLHLDRPYYASGETIWYSASVVNAALHYPMDRSGVLYIDLINPDGEIISSRKTKLINGFGEGQIEIPGYLTTVYYRIRAYTNWMKNYPEDFFYNHLLPVYNSDEVLARGSVPEAPGQATGIRLEFFPEGGQLISGIPGQMAFRVTDEYGRVQEVSGIIIDSDNNKVADFNTRHSGMGSIFFMPQPDKKYFGIINDVVMDPKPVPDPLNSGYSITVNNLKKNTINLILKSTPDKTGENIYIIGHSRGLIYHMEKILNDKGVIMTNIPKSKLPEGIFHITIFDEKHTVQGQRLVFISHQQDPVVNLISSVENPDYRQKIDLELNLKTPFGKPISSSLSVSILDSDLIQMEEFHTSISNYLLLSSDLSDDSKKPGYYLVNEDRETLIARDLLMMTNEWRRFNWDFPGETIEKRTEFTHELGINLSGTSFLKNSDKPATNSIVSVYSLDEQHPGYWATTTDYTGRFSLPGMDIPDSLEVIFQSYNAKGKAINVDWTFNKDMSIGSSSKPIQSIKPPINDEVLDYLQKYNQQRKLLEGMDLNDQILLKEVVIKAQSFDRTIYGEPDNVIKVTENMYGFTDILQLLQAMVPGLYITGSGPTARIYIRGMATIMSGTQPLILLNGMAISESRQETFEPGNDVTGPGTNSAGGSQGGAGGGTGSSTQGATSTSTGPDQINYALAMLLTIPLWDIERIDVLKNASSAAVFGMRAANGVIAVYTHKGPVEYRDPSVSKGLSSEILRGYSNVRQFQFPDYSSPNDDHILPDLRSLIYWNPSIKTDKKGNATLSFYNSDNCKRMQVIVEGITADGESFHFTQTIGDNESR
ncbi:carboxypeptidase-like regulatory domain-containing protein [Bacteroidota bacterium]